MSATGSDQPGQAGFTLLEMLVVIGITALIAGLGFPAVERLRDSAAFDMARTSTELALREARAAALRTGTPVQLALLPEGRGFVIGNSAPLLLPDGVRVLGPGGGVRFFADGSASGGLLTLTARRRTARLVVSRETGAIGAAQ